MAYSIEKIEGIGPEYKKKLKEAGIRTDTTLLERCADKKGRTAVAKATGISDTLLLEWTNHADLMRVKGVGGEYADLLEEAGVDTVKELAKRKPEALATKIAEVNAAKNLTNRAPSAKVVAKWIEEAKTMKAGMSH